MGKVVKTVLTGVAIVASIGTGIGAVLGGTMMFTAFGASIAASTIAMAASAGAAVIGALQGRPKIPQSETHLDRLTARLDTQAPRKLVVGSTAMPADIRYYEGSGKDEEYIDYILAVAAHRVGSIDEICFEDAVAWTAAGGVQGEYVGYLTDVTIRTEGTAANTIAINGGARWGADDRLTGCAYIRLRIKRTGKNDKEQSPLVSGLPGRVTIIGEGMPMYDPRYDSTVGGDGSMRIDDQSTWGESSENLIIQALNVLLGWRINGKLSVGGGLPAKYINLDSAITAANICDEDIALSTGGSQKRYRGAGAFSTNDAPMDIVAALLAGCAGELLDCDGQLSFLIKANTLATPAVTFDDHDVLSGASWDPLGGQTNIANIVAGSFTDPSALYQMPPFPSVSLPSEDGIDRVATINFAVVEDSARAERLAKQTLQRMQYAGTFTAEYNMKGMAATIGSIVWQTYSPLGWINKPFRVVRQKPSRSGRIALVLREENEAIYAWQAEDSAAVQPAEPVRFDPLNTGPILLARQAGKTAEWPGVADPDGTKPEDNATVGAPEGTLVATRYAEEVLADIDQAQADIDGLFETYGSTAAAAQSADAAQGYSQTAEAAKANAENAVADARMSETNANSAASQARTYRDQASSASQDADAAAATATTRAEDAATASNNAGQSATAAAGSASVAQSKANDSAQSASAALASQVKASTSADDAAGIALSRNRSPGMSASAWAYNEYNTFKPLTRISNTLGGGIYSLTEQGTLLVAGQIHTHPVEPTPIERTRMYRALYRFRTKVMGDTGNQVDCYVTLWDKDGNLLGGNTVGAGPGYSRPYPPVGEIATYTWNFRVSELQAELQSAAFARVMLIPRGTLAGGPTQIEIIEAYFEDVESEAQSAQSASAAVSAAANAQASQTAAGNSAQAADSAKTEAQAANANAQSAASAAQGSKASADASAASASSSKSLLAAYSATRGLSPNGEFQSGPQGWTASPNMVWGAWPYGPGFRVQNGYGNIAADELTRIDTTRTYRLRCILINYGPNPATVYAGFTCYDANKQFLGNVYMPSYRFSNTQKAPAGGVYPATEEITGAVYPANTYTHGNAFCVGTVYVKPIAFLNYPDPQPVEATLEITRLYIEDVTSEKNAETQAGIASSQAAIATDKASQASTAQALTVQYRDQAAGSAGSAQTAANTSTSQAAIATAQAAAAQSSATLAASVSGGSLNRNSTFADFPAGASIPPQWASWTGIGARTYGNGDLSTNGLPIEGSPWGFYQSCSDANTGAGILQNTPSGPGDFVVNATVQVRAGTGMAGAGILMYGLDSNGSLVVQDMMPFATAADINGRILGSGVLPGTEIFRFSRLCRLSDPRVVTVRIYAMTNWSGFGTSIAAKGLSWLRASFRAATDAEIKTRKIDNLEAQVAINQGVLAEHGGKLHAYWELQANAGTNSAVIAAKADGSSSTIAMAAAKVVIANPANNGDLRDAVVFENGEATMAAARIRKVTSGKLQNLSGSHLIDLDAGRIVFDNGSVMKVTGNGFGTSNQFLEWFGPSRAIEQCDEASAIQYVKVNGAAYFGGALSAGTIKNAAQTTSIAQDASISTGVVGSRGGARQVVVSYNYSELSSYATNIGPANSGSGISAQINILRGGVSIGTLNVSGTWRITPYENDGSPTGKYSANMGGAITISDTSGGTSAEYSARIISRTIGAGRPSASARSVSTQQQLSIVQTEQ